MRFLFILLTLLTGQTIYAASENELIEKAEKAYKEKHFSEAITSYQTLLNNGYQSYQLHYNLGNAYFRVNQIGQAIYHYELANKLDPNNNDVLTNLEIANTKTIDKIEAKENFLASALKNKIVNSLSSTEWAWSSIIFLFLALTMIFLFFGSTGTSIKKTGFFLGLISLIGFIFSMSMGYISLNDKKEIHFAIIVSKESKIYNEPEESQNQKFSLHEGTKVKVLESNKEWTSIQLENGNEGWVKTSDVGLF